MRKKSSFFFSTYICLLTACAQPAYSPNLDRNMPPIERMSIIIFQVVIVELVIIINSETRLAALFLIIK